MRRYTRHELKEDRFQEATADTLSWAVEHRKALITAVIVVLLAVVGIAAAWFYIEKQDERASIEFGAAMRTYHAPIRPEGMPADPNFQSFTSAAERAKTAQSAFRQVAEKYRHTRSGDFSHYYIGLTAMDLNDTATAENELKDVAGLRDKELSALGKFALASLYRSSNRTDQAVKLYQDLEQHPTNSVPKATSQLELASMYETSNPGEASKLYDQIRKDAPQSYAAQVAAQKLEELKRP